LLSPPFLLSLLSSFKSHSKNTSLICEVIYLYASTSLKMWRCWRSYILGCENRPRLNYKKNSVRTHEKQLVYKIATNDWRGKDRFLRYLMRWVDWSNQNCLILHIL
jgi:hypothetical protein